MNNYKWITFKYPQETLVISCSISNTLEDKVERFEHIPIVILNARDDLQHLWTEFLYTLHTAPRLPNSSPQRGSLGLALSRFITIHS